MSKYKSKLGVERQSEYVEGFHRDAGHSEVKTVQPYIGNVFAPDRKRC